MNYPITARSGKTMNGSFCKANREVFDRYSISFYSGKWTHSNCARINTVTRRIIIAVVCYFALSKDNASFIYMTKFRKSSCPYPPRDIS